MGKKNLVIDRVVPIFLAFFLFGVILYVLFTRFYYLPLGGPRSGAWVIFLLAGLLYLCGRMMGPFRRALRFQADEIVSSEFGMRNELVLALQKIGGLSLSEKGYLAGVSSQATVAQRIDKLSRMK